MSAWATDRSAVAGKCLGKSLFTLKRTLSRVPYRGCATFTITMSQSEKIPEQGGWKSRGAILSLVISTVSLCYVGLISVHRDFRLRLTSLPSNNGPVSILHIDGHRASQSFKGLLRMSNIPELRADTECLETVLIWGSDVHSNPLMAV
ncbi:hypothetical protein DPEC_G00210810 [Dallia pectoralis]|uniref:Uncharacterized protein n=1 Tax=Dallia pectoralis TaxID=75939 RepID=A0ACC2G5R6_DALPE|nr:hypothetical protein DPEC_G00210810 [Dallia pectoralis]